MLRTFLPLILLLPALAGGNQSVGHRITLSDQMSKETGNMQVRLLGSLGLRGSPALSELSGLAWDEDEQILYAVSDRGFLLHLRPEFRDTHLTGLLLLQQYPLLDRQEKPLTGHWRDSEGLALEKGNNGIRGDSELIVSFERRNRIASYTPGGRFIKARDLPPALERPETYPALNKGLEALTLHPVFGPISGPEYARDDQPIGLYSSAGHHWLYQAFEPDGGLVALEALPNGDVLILERAFSFPFSPLIISLSRFSPTVESSGSIIDATLLARFDSTEGWRTQNFEGLTRHRDNRYFMVSDDGGYLLLETQLIYFEILE